MITFKDFLKEVKHPQKKKTRDVEIYEPHSDIDGFSDPKKLARITPGSEMELMILNDIHFKHWKNIPKSVTDWNDVDGQGTFEEPKLKKSDLQQASGAIIIEPDERIWIIHPTNQFAGTEATFPKGKVDKGLNLRANAIKEAFEESGLKIELTGFACDKERTTSITRYYFAKRIGGHPKMMGWESQAVSLVPKNQLNKILNLKIDQEIVRDHL